MTNRYEIQVNPENNHLISESSSTIIFYYLHSLSYILHPLILLLDFQPSINS